MNQLASEANWCIFKRLSTGGYQMCIARLESRAECERHFKVLQGLLPNAILEIAFSTEDLKKENSASKV
ncbi:hypothetical protein Riv7116_2108 [Rivularia sp. PCC 7116]|uniref:hypothetical protein n=1 Tax=Rivularia sp. PCC 7116 TaxID=373994 RepID=UPI00029F4384|nr:hypothetical protein [Rivularia sp. PCC 7116]AFY54639.1 hypothetical protein Riv7116_2108 [Rivularia sp. PCC 7116]